MASSLFGDSPKQSPQMSRFDSIIQAAKGNPQQMYNTLLQSDPRFAQFAHENSGLSPQDIAKKYGIDWGTVQKMLGKRR